LPTLLVDLDDTVLDFGSAAPIVWREVAEAFAPALGVDAAPLVAAVDASARAFWSDRERAARGRLDLAASRREIVGAAFTALRLDAPATALEYDDCFSRERDARIRVFPGAVEALEALRARGTALALVTNGSAAAQRAKLERFDLARHFDAILVEGEFGVGKPDPSIYRAALRRLGAAPDTAAMVGDNLEWDVAAPQRLGLHAVWIDLAGHGLPADAPARPDRVVRALADLVA
jgi:putative hydrolase of the HAD superfamily